MKFYVFECWFLYADDSVVEIVAAGSTEEAKKHFSETGVYGTWEFVKVLDIPESSGVVFSTQDRNYGE